MSVLQSWFEPRLPSERIMMRLTRVGMVVGICLTIDSLVVGQEKPSNERYQSRLAHQLAMNKETWSALLRNGFQPEVEVQLEFAYDGPSEESLTALKRTLEAETDYEVTLAESDGGARWVGAAQKTTISPDILDQWVDWMITVGLRQDCIFDGWGTEIPR